MNSKAKSTRTQGTVKWWNDSKGYGFITTGTEDIFAHYSEIRMEGFKTLREGQKVTFLTESDPKGLIAVEIHPEAT